MARVTDLLEELGITFRQFDTWCSKGFIRSQTNGTGDPRTLTEGEKRVLTVMSALVLAGIPAGLAGRIARRACLVTGPGSPARIRVSPQVSVLIDKT